MIGSLLYANLRPKLKRSVTMAQLENANYKEIVTNLQRELELNGLEESDDIPVPTISTARTAHDRDKDSFHQALTQEQHATTAKNLAMSKIIVGNLNDRRNRNANEEYQKRVPKVPDGKVLERRWSLLQAQKPQVGQLQT